MQLEGTHFGKDRCGPAPVRGYRRNRRITRQLSMISTSFPTLSSVIPRIASPSIVGPGQKQRASCSWCLILNFSN